MADEAGDSDELPAQADAAMYAVERSSGAARQLVSAHHGPGGQLDDVGGGED